MIGSEDIKSVIGSLKNDGHTVTIADIAFLALSDTLADKDAIRSLIYTNKKSAGAKAMDALADILKPYGIGDKENITKDENREELIKLLKDIDNSGMDAKDAIKLKADIRLKLQTKFEIEDSEKQRRIIVVPKKHDLICKFTNRECSAMPSKEACMTYYTLVEA